MKLNGFYANEWLFYDFEIVLRLTYAVNSTAVMVLKMFDEFQGVYSTTDMNCVTA